MNNAGGVFGCQNENEEIENITYDVSIAFDMLDNDKINSVHSIVALNWLRNYLKKRNENKNL